MDFPLDLNSQYLTSGKDELYQDLTLVLRNNRWTFFSSSKLGSNVSVHIDDTFVLSEQIKSTVQTINGLTVNDIQIAEDYSVYLKVSYNGLFVDFNFNLNEL